MVEDMSNMIDVFGGGIEKSDFSLPAYILFMYAGYITLIYEIRDYFTCQNYNVLVQGG